MCSTVYRIIVCSLTKIRMLSSLRNFGVCILDADRFTIVVFQILDIKSNYLPGIVHDITFTRENVEVMNNGKCVMLGLHDP
jgi:hypothetical protein